MIEALNDLIIVTNRVRFSVLKHIIDNPFEKDLWESLSEISKQTKINRNIVGFHLTELEECGLVQSEMHETDLDTWTVTYDPGEWNSGHAMITYTISGDPKFKVAERSYRPTDRGIKLYFMIKDYLKYVEENV